MEAYLVLAYTAQTNAASYTARALEALGSDAPLYRISMQRRAAYWSFVARQAMGVES